MRADVKPVRIVGVEGQGPDALTRQPRVARINTHPRHSGIGRTIDAAAIESSAAATLILIGVADEKLVAILRIDENADVVADGQIAAPPYPTLATIMREIERPLSSNVDVSGAFLILLNRADRNVGRDAGDLTPGLSGIARDENA